MHVYESTRKVFEISKSSDDDDDNDSDGGNNCWRGEQSRKIQRDLQEMCGECGEVVMRKTGCAYVHGVQPFFIHIKRAHTHTQHNNKCNNDDDADGRCSKAFFRSCTNTCKYD